MSQAVSQSGWSCLKSNGYEFAIPRAWRSYGAIDPNAVSNINHARAAGIQYVDVYMFPCRGKSAASQVDSLISGLGSANYGMIWVDVETNPSSGCSWSSHSKSSNCDYIVQIINEIERKGKKVGVYASEYMWETVVGSRTACTAAAKNTQLWYAHYDNRQSFSDYRQIGGWAHPNIKQY